MDGRPGSMGAVPTFGLQGPRGARGSAEARVGTGVALGPRMRANIELTPGEKSALCRLTGEERDAVIDQMLERVREDLEWVVSLESAKRAAAIVPQIPLARRAR